MSDELPSSRPAMPTAEWLAEQDRKRAAYSESRRRHAERFMRHSRGEAEEVDEAEPVQPGSPAAPVRRRNSGKIHDPRQLRFEL